MNSRGVPARSPTTSNSTRSLATSLGEIDQAVAIYEELQVITEPRTRAKEQIAYVAAERIENAAAYSGALELMPPWPSDIGNCVVCHSWSAPVPMDSLYSLAPISTTDIPSTALAKPIGDLGMGKRPPEPSRRNAAPEPEPDANAIRKEAFELFLAKCMPCHSYGGEAGHLLMLDDEGAAQAKAVRILERTEAGEMPPDGALAPEEVEVLRAWKAEVEAAN